MPPVTHAIPAWQSSLQSLTHRIPNVLRSPAEAAIGQECYHTLIYNADILHVPCVKLAISKGLGLSIVIFGTIMKVPQMLKIVSAQSAAGISLGMYVLETLAYIISLAYAYRKELPFSTYGENASLTVQNVILLLLLLAYGSTPSTRLYKMGLTTTLVAILTTFLFSPTLCPSQILSVLQAATIPISLLSKVPQILELYRQKAPGQLSAIVVGAQFAGSLARIFTSLTEADDPLLFWGFALAAGFNGAILAELFVYWKGNQKTKVE